MKKTLLFIGFLFSIKAVAQEEIIINFEPETTYTNVRANGFRVLYKLTDNSIYFKQDTVNYDIVPPKNFEAKNPAYGFLRFTGQTHNLLENYILFLVDDYESHFPNIYLDYNNNLNFEDDGNALKFGADSTVLTTIQNPLIKNAQLQIKLKHLNIPEGDQKNQLETMLKPQGIHIGKHEAIDIGYWYSDEDRNSKITDVEINGEMIKIGLHDFNLNGSFNDLGEDIIMVGDYEKGFISQRKVEGGFVYEPGMLLSLGGQTYEVSEIDPTGNFMKLIESNREFIAGVSNGDPFPDGKAKFLGNPSYTLPLGDLIAQQKKYVLLDFWGSWCKACTINLPTLKELAESRKGQLMVLGLNYGDSVEKAEEFIAKKNITWANAILSQELKDKLKVESFPSYMLIGPDGKIVSLNATLSKIEELLPNK